MQFSASVACRLGWLHSMSKLASDICSVSQACKLRQGKQPAGTDHELLSGKRSPGDESGIYLWMAWWSLLVMACRRLLQSGLASHCIVA